MRRGNGDGSIFKLSGKRRNPWAVRITTNFTNDGKQKYRYLGYYPTKTDAKKALAVYLANPNETTLEKVTLKTVFDAAMEKGNLKENTIKNYKSSFNRIRHLHNKLISEITLDDLENAIKDLIPSTQLIVRNCLKNCYSYAIKYDYVTKNLAAILDVKEYKKVKQINIFTIEEINELWDNVGTEYFDDIPLILLYTGLRINELFNIKIDDVDLDQKVFNITDSKTKNGIRTLPIHHKIIPLVEKRYNPDNEYLITNKHNNNKVHYITFVKNYWKLDHTRHEARHTFTTYLTKCNDDKFIVKKILGHSINDITDHYTHRNIQELSEAINKLEYK